MRDGFRWIREAGAIFDYALHGAVGGCVGDRKGTVFGSGNVHILINEAGLTFVDGVLFEIGVVEGFFVRRLRFALGLTLPLLLAEFEFFEVEIELLLCEDEVGAPFFLV